MKDFRDKTSEEKIDCYSGDVQDIELTTIENEYVDYKQHWVDKKRREEFTKEMYNILRGYPDNEADEYIHINLDEGFEATIDWLIENPNRFNDEQVKNVIIFGTNMGKVKVYDYKRMNIIKEISLNPKKFNVSLIKELENNLIVCNSPQNKIIFIDYVSGNIQAELNLKNSSYYRKGVYLQQEGKLLLCCAKNLQ